MKRIVKPGALCRGDLIAVVAPASNIKADRLARGVAEIARLGFRSRYDPQILSKDRYTAGSDERRARELIEAFEDHEVKAIWAARGGYGSMRIFDFLDDSSIRKNPKIFIGYSDITALHLYLHKRFGLVTFHGPMVAKDIEAGADHFDEDTLMRAVTSLEPMGKIHSRGLRVLHGSDSAPVSGPLLGGCLTLINSLLATPYELDTRASILFLEDTQARPFAIDRMLTQLKLAGTFEHVRAIIFGEMTECLQTADQGYEIEDVLASCTADLGIPVAWGLESGHSPRGNLTLPLGVRATFDPSFPALQIDEAAVV